MCNYLNQMMLNDVTLNLSTANSVNVFTTDNSIPILGVCFNLIGVSYGRQGPTEARLPMCGTYAAQEAATSWRTHSGESTLFVFVWKTVANTREGHL